MKMDWLGTKTVLDHFDDPPQLPQPVILRVASLVVDKLEVTRDLFKSLPRHRGEDDLGNLKIPQAIKGKPWPPLSPMRSLSARYECN